MSASSRFERPRPRLYLVTPAVADPAVFAPRLAVAVAAVDVAAVLLRLGAGDERALINKIKHLAPIAQARGAAVLVEGRADLVARGGADGAHVTGLSALARVREVLPPDRMVGAGGLLTRHDAMEAGEAGADYVMFGEPDDGGRLPDFAVVRERTAWWAEVFEPACVAYAPTLAAVGELAAAGADFVALDAAVWDDPERSVESLRDAAALLLGDVVP